MRPRLFTFWSFALLVLCAGCTSTRVVDPQGIDGRATIERLSAGSASNPTRVHLADGRVFRARHVRVATDSTRWLTGRERVAVPTSAVERVRISRHGLGGLQGFGIGLVVGLGVGFSGILSNGRPQNELDAIAAGLLGGAIGLLIGALDGHRTTYRFANSPAE